LVTSKIRLHPALDIETLRVALDAHVRIMSLEQLASAAFLDARDPRRAARQLVHREVARGAWQLATGMARPLPILIEAIYTSVGGVIPEPGRLSYRARARWTLPYRATSYVMSAESRQHDRQVSSIRRPRASELTHDLGVTAIYLELAVRDPKRAAGWLHEDQLPDISSSVRPDAVILEMTGDTTYLDFLGAYSTSKVSGMLTRYVKSGMQFEFW
jgi:hypothetical protein